MKNRTTRGIVFTIGPEEPRKNEYITKDLNEQAG